MGEYNLNRGLFSIGLFHPEIPRLDFGFHKRLASYKKIYYNVAIIINNEEFY